jgi:NAD(P)-dependent dehydrogenase (short-subunit alcohol dehydrogenase family)
MAGKVCLITGATSGIGQATARALAERGATVVVLSRNPERCEASARAIREQTGNPAVVPLAADLSVQAEVRRAAREFLERFPRLDVLVNNAGAAYVKRRESADGIEMTWALNHLGYFLLTNLLLDTLTRSAPARVVSVSSDAHRSGRIDFDDLQALKRYRPFGAYANSKLANVLFTRELARRLEGTGVTANAMHPGIVATNIDAGMPLWVRLIFRVFGIPPERGAATAVYLATAPEVEGVSGRYFVKEKEVRPAPSALDDATARRLWDVSEAMTGLAVAS